MNWRSRTHTQARTARRGPFRWQVPRVSRPQRYLLEISMKEHAAGTPAQEIGVRFFYTRRKYVYVIVKRSISDVRNDTSTH